MPVPWSAVQLMQVGSSMNHLSDWCKLDLVCISCLLGAKYILLVSGKLGLGVSYISQSRHVSDVWQAQVIFIWQAKERSIIYL